MAYEIVAGDLEPALVLNLRQKGGRQPIDLTAIVSAHVKIWMRGDADDTPRVNREAQILGDPKAGRVIMTWSAGDTDEPTPCKVKCVLMYAGNRPQTIPSKGFFVFDIEPATP